jgi:hypothetical protein
VLARDGLLIDMFARKARWRSTWVSCSG